MSGLFKLSWRDLVKGLLVAVLSSVLGMIAQSLGGVIDWKAIGTVALSSCLAYLLKQLATDEQGKLGGKL